MIDRSMFHFTLRPTFFRALMAMGSPIAAFAATGPSFPCTPPPLDAVAHLACVDDTLGLADARMVQTYYALRRTVGTDGQKSLKSQFLNYAVDMRRRCGLPPVQPNKDQSGLPVPAGAAACVAVAYDSQRDAWTAKLSEPGAEEARRPPEGNRALQRALQLLGFIPANARIDGVFGAATRDAIVAWQHAKGRAESGFLSDADGIVLGGTPTPAVPNEATPPSDPEAALRNKPLAGPADFDGKPLSLTSGKVGFTLVEQIVHDPAICQDKNGGFLSLDTPDEPTASATCLAIMATISVDGGQVTSGATALLAKDQDVTSLHVTARIVRLDQETAQPQVFVTGYTGGAHCCTSAAVGTEHGGAWRFVSLGALDGDDPWQFLNLDGKDHPPVIVDSAPGFNYAFSSYAGSYAPTRIQHLVGIELKDTTADPRYRDYLLEGLRGMEAGHAKSSQGEPNGFLAGWVAQKALVGQFEDAWETMLASYDHDATTDRCAIDENAVPGGADRSHSCPDDETLKVPFPEGLALFLADKGYVTRAQAAAVGFDPVTLAEQRKKDMESATGLYLQQLTHSWYVMTNAKTCVRASTPSSPAEEVSQDRVNAIIDTVTVLKSNPDEKPIVVLVGEPKGGGIETVTTFYRGSAECEAARLQEQEALEQLK
jgi:peptidoglycan hydrolase-like protein with peptidoglycan-binding domain